MTNGNHPHEPHLPDFSDARWREAAVAPAKQRSTQLRPAPRTTMSTGQATVFAGDIVHIIPELQHENWVAARVGRKIGWLNIEDVDFVDPTSPKPKLEELTKPLTDTESYKQLVTKRLDDDLPVQKAPITTKAANAKAESTPKNPMSALGDIPANLTVTEIDKMLENLKQMAMTLQQAKVRAKREARKQQPAPRARKKPASKQSSEKK